jgi:hypothetical protein
MEASPYFSDWEWLYMFPSPGMLAQSMFMMGNTRSVILVMQRMKLPQVLDSPK